MTSNMTRNMTTNTAPGGRTARLFRSDDQRWEAVCRRDRRADGAFCCAVRTTGIYCRPSCSSRLPRRGNVEFYATPAQAEAAGYRACKRCKPKEAAA